ncbi:MAG TPA: hypothetical protein VF751_07095 [Chthoniobacterales bacterium]
MNPGNFFAELKRRNVYKVAVAYAVVGWLLIQAASIILPTFEAPGWTMKVLIAALAIGLPIAMMLAWAFEVTPEGIKRAEDVSPNESITHRTGRKLIATTIVLAVIAGGLLVFQMLRTKSSTAPRQDASAARTEAATPIAEKSIAVLPFENLSEDKANAFFASGIQDEILTRLAKIGALKVISRSSTQQYQSKPASLTEIGRQLGVANILEGSVQKVGNAVHINVQLIKAESDAHLWAESYNRKLDDIFAVEAEVAAAVADQLNAKLTGSEKQELAQKPTENPAAYEAYLRGIAQLAQLNVSPVGSQASFAEAVRLDPKFALAWAALCRTHAFIYFNYIDRSQSRREAAEKSLAEAVRLQPQLPETQLARAYYQYAFLRDYTGARDLLQQLRMIWPSNAEIIQLMGYISARLGEYEKSVEYLRQAIASNPRDAFLRRTTADMYVAMRDFATAQRMVEEMQQMWPNDADLAQWKVRIFQGRGELDEAQRIEDHAKTPIQSVYQFKLKRIAPPADVFQGCEKFAEKPAGQFSRADVMLISAALLELSADKSRSQPLLVKVRDATEATLKQQPDNWPLFVARACALAGLGERDEALRAADQAITLTANDARDHGTTQEMKTRLLARLGDKDAAIPLLQHLLAISYDGAYGPPLTPALLRLDSDFDSLRGDPRFEKLCQDKPQ